MNPSYFGDGASLFPIWPVIDSVRALNLFLVTMGILFAPKIYGLAYGLISPVWRREVGVKRTVLGVLTETFLSILIAPILMMTQTIAVVSVLSGRDSGWAPQQRGDEDGYPLAATFRHSAPAMLMGILLTVSALVISPVYAAWLAPATIGLVLSVALSFWTAKRSMGQRLRRHGALVSPAEVNPPASFAAAQAAHAEFANLNPSSLQSLMLDEASQHRRSLIVDPRWVLARNDVHVPLAVARARAETASTIKEYISSLTKAEKIALLNSCKDLKLVSARFAPPNIISSVVPALETAN
jgi:membrane glycosyltransferase